MKGIPNCETCDQYKHKMGIPPRQTQTRVYNKDTREGILESKYTCPPVYIVNCDGKRQAWLDDEVERTVDEIIE
jgi:hypothetical protein